jgi:hypothetical protein
MKKKEFAEQVFCSIGEYIVNLISHLEKGDAKKAKDLYLTYPEYKNKIFDRNGWNPVMYAVR